MKAKPTDKKPLCETDYTDSCKSVKQIRGKKAIAYCRVATKEQTEEYQKEKGRRMPDGFCKENNGYTRNN